MMRLFYILLALSLTQSFAAETIPWLLMPESYVNPHLKVCYRWMTAREMNAWIKNQEPQAYPIVEEGLNHLDRGGKIRSGIYCWHHPTGAMRGGPGEFYGDYLARIELVDDVVIFDRNLRNYTTGDGSPVPENMKLEIDSDVFYAFYKTKDLKNAWFQEYIIKNPRVIKSFSFNSRILIEEGKRGYDDLMEMRLEWANIHMLGTMHCPFMTSEADYTWWTFQKNPKRYYCQDTRRYVAKIFKNLENFWAQNEEIVFQNRASRQSILK